MAYYSERHGIRKQREKTYNVSLDAYNLILEVTDRYKINLAWKFPLTCPDNEMNICGLNETAFFRDLRFEIPGLFNERGFIRPTRYNNVFDGEYEDEFDQYALFDFIEYLAINVKDFVIVDRHSFFQHDHYKFISGNKSFNNFLDEIDKTFEKIGLLYRTNEVGQIERIIENESMVKTVKEQIVTVREKGLKELLEEAITLFKDPNTMRIRDATEKLWDAFERLKTYYTKLDKKSSSDKVILDAANGNAEVKKLLDEEFLTLTKIGNNYRIRHHETNKIEITIDHYEYFFNRCLSVISLALKYLK